MKYLVSLLKFTLLTVIVAFFLNIYPFFLLFESNTFNGYSAVELLPVNILAAFDIFHNIQYIS